jgi:hypothetical protein
VPFFITARVYNAAGELVRKLYEGGVSVLPSTLNADRPAFLPGDGGVKWPLSDGGRLADGSTQLIWDGVNDSGQWVGAGVYYIKLESTDSFGHSSSLIAPVTVLPQARQAWLRISNAAGEIVWERPLGVSATAFSLNTQVVALAGDGQPGSSSNGLHITLLAGGVPVGSIHWDGRNNRGRLLDSGTYTLTLSRSQADDASEVRSAKISVLRGTDADLLSQAVLGPNPLRDQDWVELRYPPVAGLEADAVLYTLSGERVAEAADPTLTGRLRLHLRPELSGGIYVCLLRVGQQRRVFKLALVR